MELFSEVYGIYYRAVCKALRAAAERPLSAGELRDMLAANAFAESALFMAPKLLEGHWPLLREERGLYAPLCVPPEGALTRLMRAWLRALLSDSRFGLFFDREDIERLDTALSDVEPLYLAEDFYEFDAAADADHCANGAYIRRFRAFLAAVRAGAPLHVRYVSGKGRRSNGVFWPYKLEYSRRDGKFRALCYRDAPFTGAQYMLNIARVRSARAAGGLTPYEGRTEKPDTPAASFREATLYITRERNALERFMVHFAHFEKRTEYDEGAGGYTCTIKYNAMEQTEVLVRVLSFGPTVRVLGPEAFLAEVRDRVKAQTALLSMAAQGFEPAGS